MLDLVLAIAGKYWQIVAGAVGGLAVILYQIFLRKKNDRLENENVDLRTKEKIVEEQAKIDERGETERAKVGTADSADDFDKLWNKPK